VAAGIELCGSLSRWAVPLGASMHQAAYEALGLPWHYVPFEIEPHELDKAVAALRTLRIRGAGVSMPFKLDVMRHCDRVEPLAARIGAVNTLVREGSEIVGHNTDWLGAVKALEEMISLQERRVLVLGAGGAARAVAFGLLERGASVTLCNRTEPRARELADELRVAVLAWPQRGDVDGFDVIVNASSMGMSTVDPASPMPADALRADQVVMDIVYKPVETALVRAARARGASVVHGGRMLLHQAASQFELYTGRPAPLDAMDAALRSQLAHT
jgi:shikimate dehydrogenase